jgi:SpoVK/Ycf46/Vps4 family AAA+-type ATPase
MSKKINEYNKLLSTLDKTNTKISNIKTKTDPIDELIKIIDANYKENKYNSINFTGWGKLDIIKSKLKVNNSNEYIDFNEVNFNLKTEKIKSEKEVITIDFEIQNINDLLKLIELYPLKDNIDYNINMKVLNDMKEPLLELNEMIGMNVLKKNILDQILYYLQNLHLLGNDFMHTVIYGPPGTGKTEIAKIMGKIYTKMGILKSGVFKKVTRSDLISGYLGQTSLKTRDVIKECLGGVLFIDEAYALGNPEKRDSFSKECIDTLCEALSDNKNELMVIIAGYENELKTCFFSYNQGLESRFTWRFKTDEYKAVDLKNIFMKKVKDISWEVVDLETSWFEKNIDYFKFYGRDIEVLLSKIKIAHSRRIFGKAEIEKKKINKTDLDNGLKIFLENEEVKERKYNPSKAFETMYI